MGVFFWLGFRGTRSPTGVRKQMPGAFAKHLSVAKMARRARLKEEPSTPESIKWNENGPKGEAQGRAEYSRVLSFILIKTLVKRIISPVTGSDKNSIHSIIWKGSKIMTKQTENLIIEILKKIQNEQTNTRESLNSLVVRTGNVEIELSHIHRDIAHLDAKIAEQSIRLDQVNNRLERVESRLEIIG